MICRYLPYTLTLRAPAVLPSLGGDPNSSRTLPFIPGSAVRGAAARGFGDPGDDPVRVESFRELILGGAVRYLNAYVRAGGRRTLPIPVSLRTVKNEVPQAGGEVRAWDLAAFDGKGPDDARWPEVALSDIGEPFVSIGAAQPVRVGPSRGSRVHHQRDRTRGRAWKDLKTEEPHGTIFAFEYLQAGNEFVGLVQIHGDDEATCDALTARVQNALGGPILVGRSRRAGYGGDATIEWASAQDREVSGQGIVATDVLEGTVFRALLASAYVGRDPETGQLDPTYLADEIVDRLGGRAEVIRRRWAFQSVGGFNRKWRMEIPQALGCTAGSVVVLQATQRIPVDDLLALEHAGFGEHRVEGLGRVVFLEAPTRTLVLRAAATDNSPPPLGNPPDLVRFAEARIVEAALQRAIQEAATRLARSAELPLPSASLLGRLRNAMRAEPKAALATLQEWLAPERSDRLKRLAMDQLDRCRIRIVTSQRLSAWLRATAEEGGDHDLAALLRLDAVAQRSHVISEATSREELTRRDGWIRARLIDATLAALARRLRQGRTP